MNQISKYIEISDRLTPSRCSTSVVISPEVVQATAPVITLLQAGERLRPIAFIGNSASLVTNYARLDTRGDLLEVHENVIYEIDLIKADFILSMASKISNGGVTMHDSLDFFVSPLFGWPGKGDSLIVTLRTSSQVWGASIPLSKLNLAEFNLSILNRLQIMWQRIGTAGGLVDDELREKEEEHLKP